MRVARPVRRAGEGDGPAEMPAPRPRPTLPIPASCSPTSPSRSPTARTASSDLASLREQQEQLFGPVASVPTAWRALQATSPEELRADPEGGRRGPGRRSGRRPLRGSRSSLDFDATLVTAHSDKQDAAPTYKAGFGFHPLGVWCDTTAEPLAAMLRPGNAGSNDADDHLELLDQAIAALPAEYQAGHQPGDDPGAVVHPILVRADSAGATHGFVDGLVEANCEFSIGYPIERPGERGLLLAQEEDWVPADRGSTADAGRARG